MGIEEEEEGEIWVTHYSSNHRILLVGEGDFSFSSSLARLFRSASNIVATSLDTYDVLVSKYKKAKRNLELLLKLGGCTFHGVDATKMKLHSDLSMQKFDRIVFNFPHAGFYGKEGDISLIERHKKLVLGFFKSASGMLRADGEIHLSHKTSFPFNQWNIEELAWKNCLRLVECVDFNKQDYPGYSNKRGHQKRCDESFHLGKCCTFKFRFSPSMKKNSQIPIHVGSSHIRSELSNSYSFGTDYQLTPFHTLPELYQLDAHLNRTSETYRLPIESNLQCSSYRTTGFDYERSVVEPFGRSWQHRAYPTEYLIEQLDLTMKGRYSNSYPASREACRWNSSICRTHIHRYERYFESGWGTFIDLDVGDQERYGAYGALDFPAA